MDNLQKNLVEFIKKCDDIKDKKKKEGNIIKEGNVINIFNENGDKEKVNKRDYIKIATIFGEKYYQIAINKYFIKYNIHKAQFMINNRIKSDNLVSYFYDMYGINNKFKEIIEEYEKQIGEIDENINKDLKKFDYCKSWNTLTILRHNYIRSINGSLRKDYRDSTEKVMHILTDYSKKISLLEKEVDILEIKYFGDLKK